MTSVADHWKQGTAGLHWGCGPVRAPGWVNSDRDYHGQEHVGDIRNGLPWKDQVFQLVVTHHALQMLDRVDVIPALLELRRVTKLGGWIRVSVPDIERAVWAFTEERDLEDGDAPTFLGRLFPDEASPGLRLNRYLTHYGQRTYWTGNALVSVLRSAGWGVPDELGSPYAHLPAGETLSGVERICELDARPDESLILEAVRR